MFLLFTNPTDARMQQKNNDVPTTYNTYKPYSCSLPLTNPTVVPYRLQTLQLFPIRLQTLQLFPTS